MSANEDQFKILCSTKTLQSEEKGFFMGMVTFLEEAAGEKWLKTTFGKCQTDRDRVKVIFEDNQINFQLKSFLKKVTKLYRKKNPEISRKSLIEAEKLLTNPNRNVQEDEMILVYLNRAIINGNSQGQDAKYYLQALEKRSELLISSKKFDQALKDLQHLSSCYKNNYEIYIKIAHCHWGLGDNKRSEIAASVASSFTKNQKEKEFLKKYIKLYKIENCSSGVDLRDKHINFNDDHKVIKSFKVQENPQCGRFMTSTTKVDIGAQILSEEPFCSCLKTEFCSTHCQNCYQRIHSAWPCDLCANVAFCSPECLKIAKTTYHKFECEIMDFLNGSGMSALSFLALRMITQSKDIKKTFNNPTRHLCTNNDQRSTKDMFSRTIMAGFLLGCLNAVGYCSVGQFPDKMSDEQLTIGEMILTSLQMLQFNAYEITEMKFNENSQKWTHIPKAVGIYSVAALFNHSCSPNIARYFTEDNRIVLKAIQPIKENEPLFENYGPDFINMPRKLRQKHLNARYWFECRCEACTNLWMESDNYRDARLQCPTKHCKNTFKLPDLEVRCSECKQHISLEKNACSLDDCENKFRQADVLMQDSEYFAAEKLYLEGLKLFFECAYLPHRPVFEAQQNMTKCWFLENMPRS